MAGIYIQLLKVKKLKVFKSRLNLEDLNNEKKNAQNYIPH